MPAAPKPVPVTPHTSPDPDLPKITFKRKREFQKLKKSRQAVSSADKLEAVMNQSIESFLKYQREAEERYEEREEKRIKEEREAAEKEREREREHELRLFTLLAGSGPQQQQQQQQHQQQQQQMRSVPMSYPQQEYYEFDTFNYTNL